MTDGFGFTVTGDREVALKFEEFPQRAHARLLERMTEITRRLEGAIKDSVPVETGRLRSEITSSVRDEPEKIVGRVGLPKGLKGAEYGKAAALEYGAHGTARVQAHLDARTGAIVRAYTRHVNIAEHDFLRGPFHAMEGEIVDELRQALDEAATA